MITQTQLEAIGFQKVENIDEEIYFSQNGTGPIGILIEESNGIQIAEIAIYKDCIDTEGQYASHPEFTFRKTNPAIEEIQQFTQFMESD